MELLCLETLLEEPMIRLRFSEVPFHIRLAISTFCDTALLSHILGHYIECPFGLPWSIILSLLIAAWNFTYIPMHYLLGPFMDVPLEHESQKILETYEPVLAYAATTLLLYNLGSVSQWLLSLCQNPYFVSATACFFLSAWKLVKRPWHRLLQTYVVFRYVVDGFWYWPGRLILLDLFKELFIILLWMAWIVRNGKKALHEALDSLFKPASFPVMSPDSPRSPFVYEPIADMEFRLILISPSRRWNLLEFMLSPTRSFSHSRLHLATFKRGDSPPYEAISHTWGSGSKSKEITLNGKNMAVTQSVHDILLRRADYWKHRYIWIDSICIDQDNIEERNTQVSTMTEIYKNASRVIAWFGYANDASLAVRKLLEISTLLHAYEPDELLKKLLGRMGPNWTASWTALQRLFSQPWFSRVWIIQEVMVAQEVHIIYGDQYFSWKTLADVMEGFRGRPIEEFLATSYYHSATNLWQALTLVSKMRQIRENFHSSEEITLDQLLASFITSQATVGKDKVYALQGLTSFAKNNFPILPVKVDYSDSTSIEDVLIEAVDFLVRRHQYSWILPLSGAGFSDRSPRLPSWVPQWKPDRMATTLSQYSKSHDGKEYHPHYRYKACGESPHFLEYHFILNMEQKTLQVKGCVVSKIKELGPYFPTAHSNSSWEFARQVKLWYDDSISFVHTEVQDPYLNGQEITEAFWRTIVGDREKFQPRPAASSVGEAFRVLTHLIKLDWLLFKNLESASKMADNGDFSHLFRICRGMNDEQKEVISELFSPLQTFGGPALPVARFMKDAYVCAKGRRWGVTKSGHMGFVPPRSMPDDLICLIYGTQTPYVLRQNFSRGSNDLKRTYTLIGECYMHGMMDGEALQGQIEESFFTLT
ncbi:related to heterokaryon incompatibility protein het-6 [Fusarium proliferatum]|nr:related to heterokaryon incompatibility protein het-6 [Fusarium proliferatum]